MKASSLVLCACVCARFCFPQAESTVALSNGIQLKISAEFGHPTGQQTLTVQMSRASGDSFYRIFRDQNGLAVFAYELAVSITGPGGALAVTAKPVETQFAARFPNADGGKPVPTLSASRTVLVGSGGYAEIGLFEVEGWRVMDRVEASLDSAAGVGSATPPSRLHLEGLTMKINGEPLPSSGPQGPVAGQYALIYVPGRGAYILSAEPVARPGFVKAGSIDGTKLTFIWNNDTYEAVSTTPILAVAGSGELWVYCDASYRPTGNWTKSRSPDDTTPAPQEFFVAASDSLSWYLPAGG
ncbi:MAG TPA: hypothetical protein VH639_05210 [Bryobacteraceae bacterium]|jgi:hypothetical protein